ncbi:DUF2303 family protein [Primorskyibacter sp. 2E107]|uniref:DUF2303 family protein n=1 Tax=Primorskyibacter sp. 2E107 TaxID=3403458 RepID=UPI003AF4EFCF
MSDPITHSPENPAETMRDVMLDIGYHEQIDTPPGHDLTKAHLITLPQKRTVQDLTSHHRAAAEYLKPARRKGTARVADLASLISWTNRFKGETSMLFASPDMAKPTLTCIADYHAAGAANVEDVTGDPSARHCHHRAVYDFPLSDEWKAWMAISGKAQSKDDMGEFIEAQAKDILDPTPAVLKGEVTTKNQPWENRLIETAQKIEGRFGQLKQLLAMSRQFQVFETSDLKVATNRDTGEAEIQFLNEHKDATGQKLNIPNLIIIAIPVFLGGAPYRMAVRSRYRKNGSSVAFIMSIYTPEKVFEAAFKEAVAAATEATGLTALMGTPET